MSRIGKKPIPLSKGVDVKVTGRLVTVKGPKGTLSQEVKEGIDIAVNSDAVVLTLPKETDELKPFYGLYRALINNMVIGVTEGFQKELELIGVGFRAAVKGKQLDVQVGYSHPVLMDIPEGIEVKVDKNVNITISGINKQLVGEFAAEVRAKRPPEPYKGKGIRYKGEYVRRKAGKTGK